MCNAKMFNRKSFLPLIVGVILTITVALAIAFTTSCTGNKAKAPVPSTAPTLPTNARDVVDANTFRVIADAYSFISSIRISVSNKSLTLTPAQTKVFNDVILSYDIAYALGVAYHGGTTNDNTALITATNNLSTQLTAASTSIVVPK